MPVGQVGRRNALCCFPPAIIVLLGLALLSCPGARAVEPGQHISWLHVEEISGVPRWRLFPFLWTDTVLNVTCDGLKDFNVYVAKDTAHLTRKFESQEKAWCGWAWWVGSDRNVCTTRLSPFGSTFVAVGKPKAGRALTSTRSVSCRLVTSQSLDWRLVGQGIAGALLFLYAGSLSASSPFRLTMGTAAFTAASVAVVLLVLYRSLPDKRKLAAGFALFGTSVLSFFRWMFGTWIPSMQQLTHSKLVWGYLGASALAGLTLSYYYDNPENAKLNTILRRAMQLVGLTAVSFSTTLPEASMAIAAGLVAYELLTTAGQWLQGARRSASEAARRVSSAFASLRRLPSRMGLGRIARTKREVGREREEEVGEEEEERMAMETPTASRTRARVGEQAPSQDSPLVQKGLILNESTGRVIQIGRATHQRLLHSGYTEDRQRGVMTPPPGGAAQRRSGSHGGSGGVSTRRRSSGGGS